MVPLLVFMVVYRADLPSSSALGFAASLITVAEMRRGSLMNVRADLVLCPAEAASQSMVCRHSEDLLVRSDLERW